MIQMQVGRSRARDAPLLAHGGSLKRPHWFGGTQKDSVIDADGVAATKEAMDLQP